MTKLTKNDEKNNKDHSDFSALVKRLNTAKPDKKDIELWEKHLAEKPDLLGRCFDRSFEHLERDIFSESNNFLYAELIKDELAKMRDALGYDDASELERLLIKQVCFNWLRLGVMERTHFNKLNESHAAESGLYWEKRLEGANKRFNRTAEALAKVKRLFAEADLKKAELKIKTLRAEEMERKSLPAISSETDFIDAETYEN